MSMTQVRNRLRAIFGVHEDSSGTVETDVGSIVRKVEHYEWPHALKIAARNTFTAGYIQAQTGSVSATQPLVERTIFVAEKPCRVKEILFCQYVSSTISTSASTSWSLQVRRRGPNDGTLSGTWSVTTFVGGLCSMSTGQPGYTGSYSHLIFNKAMAPNKLLLSSTYSKRLLKRGDVLTARVVKGSSALTASQNSGAQFFGGILKICVEEE